MKRFISFVLLVAVTLSLFSCEKKVEAKDLLSDFLTLYGADGVIYSPEMLEGEEGYIPDGFVERLYIFNRPFPENYALYFNSRPDCYYECGVFVCQSSDELKQIEEACLERIRLLSAKERAFVSVNNNVVFYSTMKNKERAGKVWREIIR